LAQAADETATEVAPERAYREPVAALAGIQSCSAIQRLVPAEVALRGLQRKPAQAHALVAALAVQWDVATFGKGDRFIYHGFSLRYSGYPFFDPPAHRSEPSSTQPPLYFASDFPVARPLAANI
jgi:hypothetical protein